MATSTATRKFRRTLSCGHTKGYEGPSAPRVKSPICEKCDGRPFRKMVKLEEYKGGKWIEVKAPTASKAKATKKAPAKRTGRRAA